VVGEAGSGKRRFVSRLLEANDARGRPAGVVDMRVGEGPNAWSSLARRVTRRRRVRRFLSAVLPGWVAAVPVVGPLVAAVIRSVHVLWGKEPEATVDQRITALRHAGAVAAVDEILAEVRGPLLIILRQFERASDADLAGAFHALRALRAHPVLVVVTVTRRHGDPPGSVEDLIGEAERYSAGQVVHMGGLSIEDWQRALAEATGATTPAEWLSWFATHSPILPRDLWSLLGEAEALGALTRTPSGWRWDSIPPGARQPMDAADIDHRLQGLAHPDRDFLATALQGGTLFSAQHAQRCSRMDEIAFQDRLARLERAGWIRLIETRPDGDDWYDWFEVGRPGAADALRAWASRVDATRSLTSGHTDNHNPSH
jgi:hypothetical protein